MIGVGVGLRLGLGLGLGQPRAVGVRVCVWGAREGRERRLGGGQHGAFARRAPSPGGRLRQEGAFARRAPCGPAARANLVSYTRV